MGFDCLSGAAKKGRRETYCDVGRGNGSGRLGDVNLQAIAIEYLKNNMGIMQLPDVVHTTIAKQAIPQYEVGFEERKQQFITDAKSNFPNVHFVGSLFNGVSINDCVHGASRISIF